MLVAVDGLIETESALVRKLNSEDGVLLQDEGAAKAMPVQ